MKYWLLRSKPDVYSINQQKIMNKNSIVFNLINK